MLTYAKVCSALQNFAGLENPPLKINLNKVEVAVKRPPLLYLTTSDKKLSCSEFSEFVTYFVFPNISKFPNLFIFPN